MYFVRLYGAGLNPRRSDPLDKIWAEFKCSLCGSISDVDVTFTRHSFDFARERQCPKCHMTCSEDRQRNLESQIDKLTVDKSRIEVEIERLTKQLEEVSIQTSANEGTDK